MSITNVGQELPRDRWSRPLIVPPEGGKPVAYTRCTTFVSVLEDTFNLSRWQQRMVAIGLAERPDLMLQIGTTEKDDKKTLNKVCESAMEAAKAHAAATIGTALHALTERIDRGEDLGVVPDAYTADLTAYEKATAGLTAVHIEKFTVLDDLKIGGTPDRVVDIGGRLMIADVKTGSIEWGIGKIAMQLAVYARSQAYDHTTGQRSSLGDIDLERAIIIHLPAGRGVCELVWVDIAAGWEGVQLAREVRGWRSRKGLSKPFGNPLDDPPTPKPVSEAFTALEDKIANATSADDLRQMWVDNQDIWTPELTDLASARTALLDNRAVA